MRLVFFGGVHGVGKTTLLERTLTVRDEKLKVVDPGELFWKHVYQQKDKTPEETEMLATELIERECRLYSLVICNWHYAVWTPSGYVPEIAFSRLVAMVERVNPECVHLVLVRAPTDVVLKRRVADRAIKKRKIDMACIEEEMAQTEFLYRLHYDVLSFRVKTVTTVFDNIGPVDSAVIKELGKILYETV